MRHEHGGSSEKVAKRIVKEVEKSAGVEISVTYHLRGEKRLPGSGPEQTAQHAVILVHTMSHLSVRSKTREERGRRGGEAVLKKSYEGDGFWSDSPLFFSQILAIPDGHLNFRDVRFLEAGRIEIHEDVAQLSIEFVQSRHQRLTLDPNVQLLVQFRHN